MAKRRLDLLLTERGLVPSRERAKSLIMAGVVYVNGQKEDKAGTENVHGYRRVDRRVHGLYAAEWGGAGVLD